MTDTTRSTGGSERYDGRTALLVVDVQNDFADPEGNLYVTDGEDVVPLIDQEIAEALSSDAPVIYTQDWHPPRTPHFEIDGGTWPVHCVQGTWGAELHPELEVVDDAPVVKKGVDGGDGYSAFSVRDPVSGQESATELGTLLERAGVSRVVVTGLAGDVCVKETALDARRHDLEVILPRAMTRMVELQEGDGEAAVEAMRAAGVDVVAR
ncbi:MAG: isochorismatase family protein [Nitriliruptoraceae bacterium]